MIFAMIVILMAMTWLLIETDLLRIQLPCGKDAIESVEAEEPEAPKDNYHPTVFTELDMPELNGNLNIVCKRG